MIYAQESGLDRPIRSLGAFSHSGIDTQASQGSMRIPVKRERFGNDRWRIVVRAETLN